MQLVVNARLSQVLLKNVPSLHPIKIVLDVIRRTVLPSREALLILEALCAAFAGPRDLSRVEIDLAWRLFRELLSIFVELLDKVERALVV